MRQGQAPTQQGSPDAQNSEKNQLFQLLQSYIKDKNAYVQGIQQLLMQSNAGLQEGEGAQKKAQRQEAAQLAALASGELAQDQKAQQQIFLAGGCKTSGPAAGLGLKRTFE